MPADRFFGATSEVRKTLQARIAATALDLACNGVPPKPFYLTGHVGEQPFSIHAEGDRLILTKASGRQEIELGGRDAAQRVLDVVARSRGRTSLASLRHELNDVGREDVDEALRKLEREGVVSLVTADSSSVTPEDHEAVLVDPIRGALVAVTAPNLSLVDDSVPAAVCPDGSPEGAALGALDESEGDESEGDESNGDQDEENEGVDQ